MSIMEYNSVISRKINLFLSLFVISILATTSIMGMNNKQQEKPTQDKTYNGFVQKIVPWMKNNPKKVVLGVLATSYFAGTPGGRELVFDCIKESKKFSENLFYNPTTIIKPSLLWAKDTIPTFCFNGAQLIASYLPSIIALYTSNAIITRFDNAHNNNYSDIDFILPPERRDYYDNIKLQLNNKIQRNKKIEKTFNDNNFYGTIPEEFKSLITNIVRKKNRSTHAEIPTGILLYGPPGNGKTLSINILAKTCNIPIINISCGTIASKYQGDAARKINTAFAAAEQYANSYGHVIIFMDEIDTIASTRDHASNSKDREAALTTLLTNMDGIFNKAFKSNITLIAATNRKDVLDTAFIRPGRFNHLIEFNNPTQNDRIDIFMQQLSKGIFDIKCNIFDLAKKTNKFSVAECTQLIKHAESTLLERKLDGEKPPKGFNNFIIDDQLLDASYEKIQHQKTTSTENSKEIIDPEYSTKTPELSEETKHSMYS